jgi:hypothetical protein
VHRQSCHAPCQKKLEKFVDYWGDGTILAVVARFWLCVLVPVAHHNSTAAVADTCNHVAVPPLTG